jgi:hypothetical protein
MLRSEGRIQPMPKKGTARRKSVAITVKGNTKWREWLDGLAKHCRSDASKVIDSALIQYARTVGYAQEAPER